MNTILEKITGVTLLSIEEAETLLTEEERKYHNLWWLRSPGFASCYAALVNYDGSVCCGGLRVDDGSLAVRPALQINLESSNLNIGDKFKFGGQTFKIISKYLAFCEGDIGRRCFRKYWRTDDANIYDNSDIKVFADRWFRDAKNEEYKKINAIPLTLVVGRTGTGKSAVAEYISNVLNKPQVRSYTTRPMRAGEDIKSDHIFIQPDEVDKYRSDMSAYTKIGEMEYFTTWDILEKCAGGIYVIDPKGVYDLRNSIKNAGKIFDLKIIYVSVYEPVRMKRLEKRGDIPEVAKKRILDEKQQFDDFELKIAEGKEPSVVVIDNSGDFSNTEKQLESFFANNF